jgi:RNA polymerase sigma factor (sigma-70 family)
VGKKNKIDEEALVKMLYGRNPSALGILYDNYSAALYGIIYRIVQDHVIAESILQDVFHRIWNNFEQYDASKGRLFTWIINISRNLALDNVKGQDFSDRIKNLSLERLVAGLDSERIPGGISDRIGTLEPEYKLIIDLIYFQGLTQFEVAEKLNIPLGTVKSRMHVALQRFEAADESIVGSIK